MKLKEKSNLELIRFIKNKTDKLCWAELDIATDILEERLEILRKKIILEKTLGNGDYKK